MDNPNVSAPLQLYVHIPFCEKKCHYCDFASWELPASRQRPWTETLLREMEIRGQGLEKRAVRTVFFGGGTPSVLAPEFLEALVLALRSRFDCSKVEEWTIECNPSSLNRAKLSALKELGFTRVSLGVQSFDAGELKRLGRVHSPEGAHAALRALAEFGHFAFSGDLIFGQPEQSLASFLQSLETMLTYDPSHVSFYGLTIEAGTEFDRLAHAGRLRLPDPEAYNAQYLAGVEFLAERGYQRYEVSNFAKPGLACRHNQGYWNEVEYLALGPGAHSLLAGNRMEAPRGFEEYLQWGADGFPLSSCGLDVLDGDSRLAERIFLSLRQAQGLDIQALCRDFQIVIPAPTLDKWLKAGMLEKSGNQVKLIGEGWLLLDEIASDLLAKIAA